MTIYILFATVVTGAGSAHAAFGIQFALFFVASLLLSTAMFVYGRRHLVVFTFAFLGGSVAFVMAATGERGPKRVDAPNAAVAAQAAAHPARIRTAGETLFRELGCTGCHRADGKGIGPSLVGRFGTPLADAGCGAMTVDEDYVRESILIPAAIVRSGFPAVMPTFAGRLNDDDLEALVAYVKSLSAN